MPTNLTPQEQLTAANLQFKNWYNQQTAFGNNITVGDVNACLLYTSDAADEA